MIVHVLFIAYMVVHVLTAHYRVQPLPALLTKLSHTLRLEIVGANPAFFGAVGLLTLNVITTRCADSKTARKYLLIINLINTVLCYSLIPMVAGTLSVAQAPASPVATSDFRWSTINKSLDWHLDDGWEYTTADHQWPSPLTAPTTGASDTSRFDRFPPTNAPESTHSPLAWSGDWASHYDDHRWHTSDYPSGYDDGGPRHTGRPAASVALAWLHNDGRGPQLDLSPAIYLRRRPSGLTLVYHTNNQQIDLESQECRVTRPLIG
jgi:hypothetical protein